VDLDWQAGEALPLALGPLGHEAASCQVRVQAQPSLPAPISSLDPSPRHGKSHCVWQV
jgi:hypothetical protein